MSTYNYNTSNVSNTVSISSNIPFVKDRLVIEFNNHVMSKEENNYQKISNSFEITKSVELSSGETAKVSLCFEGGSIDALVNGSWNRAKSENINHKDRVKLTRALLKMFKQIISLLPSDIELTARPCDFNVDSAEAKSNFYQKIGFTPMQEYNGAFLKYITN